MSALAADCGASESVAASDRAPARVALLGTGTVGSAVLDRLASWRGTRLGERLCLVYAANSRAAVAAEHGLCPRAAQALVRAGASIARRGGGVWAADDCHQGGAGNKPALHLPSTVASNPHPPLIHAFPCSTRASSLDDLRMALSGPGTRILIDATASEAVAERHAQWLAQGIHVVTACKLGQGTGLARWGAIRAACAQGNSSYGDSATVGAGLPLLRSIRELQAGGDRIHAIAGVLSGSLAWLFNHFDGVRPFSGLLREARTAGFTEPDPREDLSGEDVRRKLVILARAAGVALEADAVEVHSLVPAVLAALPQGAVDAALSMLDAPLRERFAAAGEWGEKLRFIARLDCNRGGGGHARIGLESLRADHPLAGGAGTDNRVAIWSDRYSEQPLLIQGPGAGAEVTAAGLLDDVLRFASAPTASSMANFQDMRTIPSAASSERPC